MGLSLQHLFHYAEKGEVIVDRIVTGDETWVHNYQPDSKRASMQWKYPSSSSIKKFNVTSTPCAGKFMIILFGDFQRLLLAQFQKRHKILNSASYREFLLKLRDAIRRKGPGQLPRIVLLHHENARPPYSSSNLGENSRNTSSVSLLQPGLGP
jgi:hypothetical protein